MKRRLQFVSILLIATLLAACAQAQSPPAGEPGLLPPGEFDGAGVAPMEEAAATAVISRDVQETSSANTGSAAQPGSQDRLIIRNGNLEIVVQDTDAAANQISALALGMEGWVVSADFFDVGVAPAAEGEGQGTKQGVMTIRVPADEFDRAVERIKALAVETRREVSDSQDVTEEYVDLSARLRNLEATADRVRAFLDEADNVEEALAVNQELSRLESEIEALKGRIQFLERSAAYSSITISLLPDELSRPIEIAGWRPEGIARDAIEALVGALQGVASVAIWLVLFLLPLALVIGIPVYLIIRAARRRQPAA
ncbi:MAG: DUF4349 domain-containing protein [Candidatus Promineifilaceae bacterium]